MKVDIKVPAVGESVTEATIGSWNKKTGDYVKRDEILLTLETDKASVEVVAENAGVLTIQTEKGVIPIGAVIGSIDTEGKASAGSTAPVEKKQEAEAPKPSHKPGATPQPAVSAQASGGGGAVGSLEGLSPSVRRIAAENQLNVENIQGSGRGGRVTKTDALDALSKTTEPSQTKSMVSASAMPVTLQEGGIRRVAMTTIRKRIAERLVEAQSTAAILTTFNEIDMSNVIAVRNKYKDSFKEKYGINLGFMGFFVKAAVAALKKFPEVNASIEGTDIVYKDFVNMGIAVGTPKGLMVPVIRDVDQMSLAEIELSIRDFAQKARDNKISVQDLSGGTFTISNGGVYGSLMSTPILNPPQSGILGMHKIEERPIAVQGRVEIRPMMYVALSYDHRIIDGGQSVGFLVAIKEGVEDPTRLLLEV